MTTIELPPETVRDVVMTCVVLHNILRSQYQGQHGAQELVVMMMCLVMVG